MKKIFLPILLISIIFSLLSCLGLHSKKNIDPQEFQPDTTKISFQLSPPAAEQIPDTLRVHGMEIIDNYSWLKDKTRSEQKVLDYIHAENDYTGKMLRHTEKLQNKIYREIIGRMEETDLSVPVKRDSFYYYWKKIKGKQYSIYCRKKNSLENPEEIVLNPNKIAENYTFCDVSYISLNPNQDMVAYGVDTTGAEKYTLYIKDLNENKILPDRAYPVGDICWGSENIIFYITEDISGRTEKVFRHTLGEPIANDKMIFSEPAQAFYVWMYRSLDDEKIILSSGSKTTSEIRYLNSKTPLGKFNLIQPRKQGVKYYIAPHYENLYIVTNADNAINNKVMRTTFENPNRSSWQEFIPPEKNCKIDIGVFEDYIVVYKMRNGIQKLKIMDLKTDEEFYINFPDSIYTFSTWGNETFATDKLRLTYESLTTPPMIMEYDLKTGKSEILKRKKVLGKFDSADYHATQIFAKAKDGTPIPISLVYKKDMYKQDGSNPLLLYAYGSYGDVSEPYFSTSRLSLLDRGFIYALAHIRGGGECGEEWYNDGKMMNKKNTFNDYIAAAEYLLKKNYTTSEKLVGEGCSAGGLLIGAVANMRPELFEILIADVPFVDLINSMFDTTLSAVVSEYEEWGNPNKKEEFDYMLSYSPYDNVKKQDYPNMLILAGFYDTRVNFWESAKWTAKLRKLKTDDHILLLKTNMAGHAGSSGWYDYFRDIAFEYAFILDILKMGK
ncbi:MAG: S9 family peptidase [Candidatus Cloacimonadota bacterium]|nr:S9 family peptidase [Candidatus Cloacimonadota bacterium]